MKTFSARDRQLLLLLPALLAAVVMYVLFVGPEWSRRAQIAARLKAAGGSVAAVRQAAEAAARTEARTRAELAAARERFMAARAELERESPNPASELRSKPGALAALNAAVARSGAKIVSATVGKGRSDASAGDWNVTFLATYEEMRLTLDALAETPGVLVRRIDRIAPEDIMVKPIWKLIVEM